MGLRQGKGKVFSENVVFCNYGEKQAIIFKGVSFFIPACYFSVNYNNSIKPFDQILSDGFENPFWKLPNAYYHHTLNRYGKGIQILF